MFVEKTSNILLCWMLDNSRFCSTVIYTRFLSDDDNDDWDILQVILKKILFCIGFKETTIN